MRQKKFKEAQIVQIIREGERPDTDIGKTCRRRGISEATFYRWRRLYAGVDEAKVAQLKQLKLENERLKKLMVERDLELDVVRDELRKTQMFTASSDFVEKKVGHEFYLDWRHYPVDDAHYVLDSLRQVFWCVAHAINDRNILTGTYQPCGRG